MEKFPNNNSEKKGKTSNIVKTMRATLAGAALLGASQLVELPRSEATTLPAQTTSESYEGFDAEHEADAFIEAIAVLEDSVIQDARGRRTLMTAIEEKLNIFALALHKEIPYFSKNETVSLSGTVTEKMREKAEQLLITTLDSDSNNFAVQTLSAILVNAPLISPERKKELGDW